MTHYETLGLPNFAPATEVRRAFLKLAVENHPDKGPDSSARFYLISEAWGVLKDAKARAAYDKALIFRGVSATAKSTVRVPCTRCEGTGKVYYQRGFTARVEKPCPACDGVGIYDKPSKKEG